MSEVRKIELLAPAKNLECGIEAVNHGADAVYIGASKFGARVSAGNSFEDIQALVDYAHTYGVKIYVTVNTILKDEELSDTEKLIHELYRIGVDALIIQDMGILKLNIPPIALHASTQMDNRTPEKVNYLAQAGFSQVVLARELTLQEIKEIHHSCTIPLEVFVHGALCVSYSGQCYASQACFGRSANRGECAQFCRMAFDLEDADGNILMRDKHLLSLKDLNQSDHLEELLDAGVTSLKIEGRLKDVGYVKNITALYRKRLDEIFHRRKEYVAASCGKVHVNFTPQADKSFNRGFSSYFLMGRTPNISSFDTPKSIGERMGYVKELRGQSFTVAGVKPFNNGDGLCFFDQQGHLNGFRVNRVENNCLYPQEMPAVSPKTEIYRNYDQKFEQLLLHKTAERKISVWLLLSENATGFILSLRDEEKISVTLSFPYKRELAKVPQEENIRKQLSKFGNSPFEVLSVETNLTSNWFIPSSVLSEWRRTLIEKYMRVRKISYHPTLRRKSDVKPDYIEQDLTYTANVMNEKAKEYYTEHGVETVDWAFEREPVRNEPIMFCRYCLRYALNGCPVYQKKRLQNREPYYLVSKGGEHFRLEFDCKNCQMKVYED